MTRIPVGKAAAIFAETEAVTEQIRQLAYHLFESRGGSDGRDVDDWLAAERELILTPESVLVEKDGKFEIRIPAAGYEARDIHVTALPASLVVRAASENRTGQKILLRNIELPEAIDVDRTTARLDNGTLFVTAALDSRKREPAAV